MKYYDLSHKRFVFIQKKTTQEFWDEYGDAENFREVVRSGKNNSFILNIIKKYLKTGRILEEGYDFGAKIFALHTINGYDAYGVDFAISTIKKINTFNTSVSELQVYPANVMHLPFCSSAFDGYWSLGMIEHFYTGYASIADEMHVYSMLETLFLTFPYMSPLRKLKAKAGIYPLWNESLGTESFYQFALDKDEVIREFEKRGFQVMETKSYDDIKGFKDEVQFVKSSFQCLLLLP